MTSSTDPFPFAPGDFVITKGPDTVWDADGREHTLTKSMRGIVDEICHDPEWTTHVWVKFPDLGRVCVGWDVLEHTSPSWQGIDGLEYQERLRKEWDENRFTRFRGHAGQGMTTDEVMRLTRGEDAQAPDPEPHPGAGECEPSDQQP